MTAFVVRRFVDRSLLVDLSVTPDGTLHHPDQVAEICRPEDLADLVTADTPARARAGRRSAPGATCRLRLWCGSDGSAPRNRSRSASAPAGPEPSTSRSTPPPPSTRSSLLTPRSTGSSCGPWRRAGALRSRRCARSRSPYRRKPSGVLLPTRAPAARKGGPGRGRSPCVPFTRARQPAPTRVGRARSRRSGSTGRPLGYCGDGRKSPREDWGLPGGSVVGVRYQPPGGQAAV